MCHIFSNFHGCCKHKKQAIKVYLFEQASIAFESSTNCTHQRGFYFISINNALADWQQRELISFPLGGIYWTKLI